jgi:hypothetical protein
MLSNHKILKVIGLIAVIIFIILSLDFAIEAALDGWNNPI